MRPAFAAAPLRRGRRLHFVEARRAAMTAAFVLIAGSTRILACPMCFGAEETSMIDGTKLGMMVMLGITLAVQAGFVTFFVYLRKRAQQNADPEVGDEVPELQGS